MTIRFIRRTLGPDHFEGANLEDPESLHYIPPSPIEDEGSGRMDTVSLTTNEGLKAKKSEGVSDYRALANLAPLVRSAEAEGHAAVAEVAEGDEVGPVDEGSGVEEGGEGTDPLGSASAVSRDGENEAENSDGLAS